MKTKGNNNVFRILLGSLMVALLVRLMYEPCKLSRENNSKTTREKANAMVDLPLQPVQRRHKFDAVSETLYRTAVLTPGLDATKRQPFVLDDTWHQGTGGLDNNDRKTIGKLYYEASSVFEFGLGESTLIAAATQVPRYAGVDSAAEWVESTRDKAAEQNRINHFTSMSHFRFYFSDIGATKDWGFAEKNLAKNEYDYQVSALMAEQEAFDVYLVDGRYRVACACVSFLHAMKHGGDLDRLRVAVHDNDPEHQKKRQYNVLQEVADVVVKNKKLWVYRLKDTPGIEQDVYELWERTRSKVMR